MEKIFFLFLIICFIPQLGYSQTPKLKQDIKIESPIFGYLYGLAVDDKGNIFVSDVLSGDIKMINPSGDLVQKIGKRGKGPGEFLVPKNLSLIGNQLFVYDDQALRLSKFEISENITLNSTISVDGGMEGAPEQMFAISKNHFLGFRTPPFMSGQIKEQKMLSVDLLNNDGTVVEKNILEVAAMEYLITENEREFEAGIMPFGKRPILYVDPNGFFYYANNQDLVIYKYSLRGEPLRKFNYSIEKRIPLEQRDWENELEKFGYDLNSLSEIKRKTDKQFLPLFNWFVVDDSEKVWVALNTEDRKEYDLLIFDTKGELLDKTVIPSSVEFKVIRNGFAYGILEEDDGSHALVRYKIVGLTK